MRKTLSLPPGNSEHVGDRGVIRQFHKVSAGGRWGARAMEVPPAGEVGFRMGLNRVSRWGKEWPRDPQAAWGQPSVKGRDLTETRAQEWDTWSEFTRGVVFASQATVDGLKHRLDPEGMIPSRVPRWLCYAPCGPILPPARDPVLLNQHPCRDRSVPLPQKPRWPHPGDRTSRLPGREKSAPPLVSSRQGYGLTLILPFPQNRPFSFKELTLKV